MKLLGINEAERSSDINIKMVATRASRYRVFGSPERIPNDELAVVDLRGGDKPDDFEEQFQVLDRHPMMAIMLVRRLTK